MKNVTSIELLEASQGILHVNGKFLNLVELDSIYVEAYEPIFILWVNCFKSLNIRVYVSDGDSMNQIMVVSMVVTKDAFAYNQKYHNESSKRELKELFIQDDKVLLISDFKLCDAKPFSSKCARTRFQKP